MAEIQIEQIVLDCNRLALENLGKGNQKACLHLLRRAQDLLNTPDFPESKTRLQVITFNNLGCYHKHCQKYNLAMQSFQKAFDLKSDEILEKEQAAEIHINVCFIRDFYSQFENLLFHAKRALEHIQSCEAHNKDLMPLTLYYLGRAFQGLEQPKQALSLFKQGLEISYKILGHTHTITSNLLQSYLSLSKLTQLPSNILPSGRPKFEAKCKTPDHLIPLIPAPHTKPSPVKPDSRLMNDLYFEDPHQSYIKRPCRMTQELSRQKTAMNTSNSSLSESKRRLNSSGRVTPEYKLRSVSSSQSTRVPEKALPSIRATSSRQRTSLPQSDIAKNLAHKRVDEPITANLMKIHEKKAPLPPQTRKKTPNSARPVHFRKPSTESLINNAIIADISTPKPLTYKNSALVLIQKMWRGYLARKLFKTLRRRAAGIRAQKAVAELEELKRLAMLESQEITEIAKKPRPQSSQLPVIKEAKAEHSDGPVIIIQKYIRMFVVLRRYKRMKKAAITLQSYCKMLSVRGLYQSIHSAIVYIQRYWRCYHSKKPLR